MAEAANNMEPEESLQLRDAKQEFSSVYSVRPFVARYTVGDPG
jgi:hypothetical protein